MNKTVLNQAISSELNENEPYAPANYAYGDVKRQRSKDQAARLREMIDDVLDATGPLFIKGEPVLKSNGEEVLIEGACYAEMEPYLVPPGRTGSKAFDQANAVVVLLKHDKLHKRRIQQYMERHNMSERLLWERLVSVLRGAGFRWKSGRIIGILEDQRTDEQKAEDNRNQPDVD